MDGFWYLWRLRPESDWVPESIGCLRATPDAVSVVACEDQALLAELDVLLAAPAIRTRVDSRREHEGREVIATEERVVRRGEPDWPAAVMRELSAATGVRITPTPTPY